MNQIKIGQFIALKRKENNLTQKELALKLGITNKSVSKWETGRCMPDYSVIENLCCELNITINELLSGQSCEKGNELSNAEKNSVIALEKIQRLEKDKNVIIGLLLVILGVALGVSSRGIGGSSFKDFVSGIMSGLSVGIIILGVFVEIFSLKHV